jgi:p-hydroxybenzoate 3-monooxygenase
MQYQRLYLAGDSAHIVPPTGAKGLNLAASDVHYLACALIEAYASGNSLPLAGYSTRALSRVWKSEQFFWWFTKMTHQLSHDGFDIEMRKAELNYFTRSDAGKSVLAENYVGLAY